jgi:hypothetical protein
VRKALATLICLLAACDLRPPRPVDPPPAADVRLVPRSRADGESPTPKPVGKDLDAARELNQQGVVAFESGRYRDAIRLFREARRLGGPPSELWNIARCHQRLDEAEEAIATIDEYLSETLSPEDRAEAVRERDKIRARPSVLTTVTVPPGAAVFVDGQFANGYTPLSSEIAAGSHSVTIKRGGYETKTVTVEAKLGRAVIVEIELVKAGK